MRITKPYAAARRVCGAPARAQAGGANAPFVLKIALGR